MNAITAKIGADIAPLKKELAAAEKMAKATAKKAADDAKAHIKQGEKDFKEAVKNRTDAEKAAGERAKAILEKHHADEAARSKDLGKRAEGSVAIVRNGLAGAGNASDLVVSGFEAIGALSAPIAGVAAGIGVIASGMWDAKESARLMHREFSELARETVGKNAMTASAGDLRGGSGRITEMLRQRQLAKDDMAAKFGDWTRGSESKTLTGAGLDMYGAKAGNAILALTGNAGALPESTAKDEADTEAGNAKKERYRTTLESIKADKEDLDIVRQSLTISEREAAIAEAKLRAIRDEGALRAQMQKEGFMEETIAAAIAPLNEKAGLAIAELERKGDEVWTTFGEESEDASARAHVALTAVTSQLGAMREELALINKEYSRETGKSKGGTEERSLEHQRRAMDAKLRGVALEQQIAAAERAMNDARTDSANAQAQSAINVVALTNKGLAQKQQLALIEKQLADLAERRMRAEEGAKPAIDAQAAALRAQAAQVQNERNQLSPVQRARRERAERAELRRLNRNARGNAAIDRDRDHAAQVHADNVKPWNIAHPAVIVKPDTEVKRALDEMKAELRTWNQRPARIA